MPKKVFAIGDIHGCASELKKLLKKLPLDLNSTVVFLGDYVDRGPDSQGVIQTIIELQNHYDVVPLLGNHEDMMREFLRDPSSTLAGFFILNGGSATLASYVTEGNHYEVPDAHVHFLNNLQLYYETDTHFFVHAGVPNVQLKKMDHEAHKNEMLWIRNPFLSSSFKWEKIIVHGHTPCDEVEITKNRINLDTGCVFEGCLSAIEVNSGQIYQVEADEPAPHTYLKEHPERSRVAKRFLGNIPVFVETEMGYEQFSTVNYNEFGLLIVDVSGSENRIFEIGQILKGKIGDLTTAQVDFVGQVVRHQKRGDEIAYGIKMIEPLGMAYRGK